MCSHCVAGSVFTNTFMQLDYTVCPLYYLYHIWSLCNLHSYVHVYTFAGIYACFLGFGFTTTVNSSFFNDRTSIMHLSHFYPAHQNVFSDNNVSVYRHSDDFELSTVTML